MYGESSFAHGGCELFQREIKKRLERPEAKKMEKREIELPDARRVT